MMTLMKSFLKDESGAAAIDYAMIAAFVAITLVGAITSLGSSLNGVFTNTNSAP